MNWTLLLSKSYENKYELNFAFHVNFKLPPNSFPGDFNQLFGFLRFSSQGSDFKWSSCPHQHCGHLIIDSPGLNLIFSWLKPVYFITFFITKVMRKNCNWSKLFESHTKETHKKNSFKKCIFISSSDGFPSPCGVKGSDVIFCTTFIKTLDCEKIPLSSEKDKRDRITLPCICCDIKRKNVKLSFECLLLPSL
jgi:hypothetical protein